MNSFIKIKKEISLLTIALFATVIAFSQNGNTGFGNPLPNSRLTVNGSFSASYNQVTSSTYTMNANDYYVVYNGAGAGTITLPVAATGGGTTATAPNPSTGIGANLQGRLYYIKNTTAAQNLTLTAAGTETIDGNATITVGPGQSVQLISTGLTGAAATWEVVTFNSTTATGCVPQYMYAGLSPSQTLAAGVTTTVLFNGVGSSSGITLNTGTGVFTLTAGNTYQMDAGLLPQVFSNTTIGYVTYYWADAVSGNALSTSTFASIPPSTYNFNGNGSQQMATIIFTPTTNQTVCLKAISFNGTASIISGYSYAMIKQLNACPGGSGSVNPVKGLFVKSAGTQVFTGAATINDWAVTTNDFGSAWNGSVYTVPAGMQGWYSIGAAFQTNADGATARTPFNHIQIMVNGATIARGSAAVHITGGTVNADAPGSGTATASISYYLNAGDQVSIIGNHLTYTVPGDVSTSAAPLPANTYLSVLKQ
jgi:hypothetical protein